MQCAYIDSTGQSIKTRGPIASPHYNTTPHCRPLLQHDAPFQTLTTTRRPISDPHYNTTPNFRPSLQHDAPLQGLTTTRRQLAGPHYNKALLQTLSTTWSPIPGPHYNTTLPCRSSLQHDASLQAFTTTGRPIAVLTTTRRPIANPHYNTTPHCKPSLQHDAPLQALTTTRHPIAGPHNTSRNTNPVTVSSSRPHRSSRNCCGPLSYPRGRPPEWAVPLNDQAVMDFFSPVVGRARWDCRLYWSTLNVASTVRYMTATW